MDDYAGRVLADRYRLPLPPSDGYELVETRAFDTYSGQEVLVRQVPLPEIVDAEVLDADGQAPMSGRTTGRAVRRSTDPAVRRAIEAAQSAAQVPDHPRLDQVFDVFAEAGSLWIVSELVAARPLAALLAERPLTPYRAAEIGSDVLTALRVLHAHGWTHRNITVRTVLVCDDGRVMLTGLAAGAAEEALCGYATGPQPDADPVAGPTTYGIPAGEPTPPRELGGAHQLPPARSDEGQGSVESHQGHGSVESRQDHGIVESYPGYEDAESYQSVESYEAAGQDPDVQEFTRYGSGDGGEGRGGRGLPVPPLPQGYAPRLDDDRYDDDRGNSDRGNDDRYDDDGGNSDRGNDDRYDLPPGRAAEPVPGQRADGQEIVPRPAAPAVPYTAVPPPAEPGASSAAQLRAARAGAIAAYRAGARAAARVTEDRQQADGAPADLTKPQRDAGGAAPAAGSAGSAPGTETTGAGTDRDAGTDPQGSAPGVRALPYQRPAPAAPGPTAPWGSPAEDPYDDEDDEDDEEGPRPPGRRVHLAGTWDDGPRARPVSAGGSGEDALRADSRRPGPPVPAPKELARTAPTPAGRTAARAWEDAVAGGGEPAVYRGPATPLAAERARQARIAVVGAVTERWAPEQAGPVHENWQLAPPIGPSTDLWALGALLYRAVQGHAPYPEENAAELVQMVCGEPPAFAEECGPLRPVVESLLRQDPTERPDFEELRGWLRSLVRSAPEPEAGSDVVTLPAPDATRLPVVRRRGELVRRRRGRFGGGAAQGRHRQGKRRQPPGDRGGRQRDRQDALLPPDRSVRRPVEAWEEERPARAPRAPKGPRVLREPPRRDEGASPRRLGRLLLVLILLLMAAAVAYAVMFLPSQDAGEDGGAPASPGGSAAPPAASGEPEPSASASGSGESGSQQPQTSRSAAALAPGYTLRKDAEGFEVGVPKDWQRSPANADRQIRYGSDGFTLLVVPGRDTVKASGGDPLDYQRDKEPELQPFRDSSWSSSSGLRRVDVGRQAMAEGQFTWQESGGREVFVRNLAMIVDGRYHVIQVIGPENDRDKVTEIYEQAIASYRIAG
ncbi:protein kinase [Streptomyces sp. NPDC058576]|uniref:protein kinase n=1 Tax=Streptomyces sp. NPDC058576 TaxID=3346547 RepID=UPI0036586183